VTGVNLNDLVMGQDSLFVQYQFQVLAPKERNFKTYASGFQKGGMSKGTWDEGLG
jgi:alpha/beta superfamily hydrolase